MNRRTASVRWYPFHAVAVSQHHTAEVQVLLESERQSAGLSPSAECLWTVRPAALRPGVVRVGVTKSFDVAQRRAAGALLHAEGGVR